MKKTNFTRVRPLWWMLLPMMLFFCYNDVAAQALACNDNVQVSVNPTPNACEAEITADMFVESPDPNVTYDISITTAANVPVISGSGQVVLTSSNAYFGQTLTATVTNPNTGNSCWGQFTLEDKIPPVITCTDATLTCTDDPGTVAPATAVDNCDSNPDIQLVNEVIDDSNKCNDATPGDGIAGWVTITRTFIAVDEDGNTSASCDQVITINRPSSIDFPDDIIWSCSEYDTYPNIIEPTPLHSSLSVTGSGIPQDVDGTYCLYQYTHYDAWLTSCGTSFKIVRTWTVLDWCTGQVVNYNDANDNGVQDAGEEDNVQIVKVIDDLAPVITGSDFTASANIPGQHPNPCVSQDFIPPAAISDNCNGWTSKIFTPAGEAIYVNGFDGAQGGIIPPPGLDLGQHDITYSAEDECGNISELTVTVTVVDDITPGAVCDEITDVNLSSDGYATVNASTFDDGSVDNCCLGGMEVRRMTDNCNVAGNLDWGPTVKFCCEDIDAGAIMVQFRVWDCAGNYNECMVEVYVQDKMPPQLLSCPAPTSIDCDDYWDNYEAQISLGNYSVLDGFGAPSFFDNCEVVETSSVTVNIDNCGDGSITRSWTATDPSNNTPVSCSQVITVYHVSDWGVEFPADITVNCTAGAVPDFGEPDIFDETCELVAVSYSDQQFDVVTDACYKIIRTYEVINWCVVGVEIDDEAIELSEVALGIDFNGNGLNDRTFRDSWDGTATPGAAQGGSDGAPDTDIDQNPWDGYITYEQVIKVIDDVAPEFVNGCDIEDVEILDNTCGATILLPTPEVEDCSPNVTVTVFSSDLPNGSGFGPYVNVPVGTYTVIYQAMDNCGNSWACESTFDVIDAKNPSPYCVNGLVIEIMNSVPPMVEVWAVDFDNGSFDNCPGPLKISLSADVNHVSETYDCSQLGQQVVELWVTDAAGNQDFCTTFVEIQDNSGQCGGNPLTANVGGAISNEEAEPVEDVTVEISGQSTGMLYTNASGAYNFSSVPLGNDITVTPSLDVEPLNGVTTYDLVLIAKHILTVQPLDTPFKIIAADANNSGTVTTLDMVEIRKLILQINSTFTNNNSWRFVDADFSFPEPTNPFASNFPEIVNINNLPATISNADFVAVKIGDVNGSAVTTNLLGADDRNVNGEFVLSADDLSVKAGETFTVEFSAADLAIQGYQFTLNFDQTALEFVELIPGLAKEENFGFTLLNEGAITASWNGQATENVIFSAVFTANSNTQLSNVLSIDSRYTQAEAYHVEGDLMDVALSFNGTKINEFALYQNTPNPFNGETVIGFNLPEAGAVTFTVQDVSGRVLNVVEGDFAKGYNEILINSNALNSNGVLYYTLETAANTATRKMIIVK